jgi:hypothetical protein
MSRNELRLRNDTLTITPYANNRYVYYSANATGETAKEKPAQKKTGRGKTLLWSD